MGIVKGQTNDPMSDKSNFWIIRWDILQTLKIQGYRGRGRESQDSLNLVRLKEALSIGRYRYGVIDMVLQIC